MDYYKLRRIVAEQVKIYLGEIDSAKEKGVTPPPYLLFQRRMILSYGITSKMLSKMIEDIVPGAEVIGGEITKREVF